MIFNDTVIVKEQTAPATPAAGHVALYAKSDGNLYQKDDAGTETNLTGTGAPSTPAVGSMTQAAAMAPGQTYPFGKSSFDWLVSEGIGKWAAARSQWVYDGPSYPDLRPSSIGTSYARGRVFKFGSTWGALCRDAGYSYAQTTTDLATMTNRDIPAMAVDSTISATWIDEANGLFVCIIWGGKSYVYSSDGLTWTFVPYVYAASDNVAPSTITDPVVVNGTYSFYDSTQGRRYYTTDHVTFTQVSTSVLVGGDHNGTIHLCNGLLFLFKNSSTTYYTSNDGGITWVARTWPATAGSANTTPTIVHNGTNYLFTTQAVTSNTSIWTSPDLTTWTNRTCAFTAAITINRLSVANGVFFAFSSVSQTKFCTSPDGITWTERTANSAALYGMAAYVNSKYMIFATTRTEGSAALATWAAETTSGPSALSRIGADVFLVIDAANSKLVFCTSTGIWTAYSGGAWSSILTTAQVGTQYFKAFVPGGTTFFPYLVRVKT